MSAAISLARSLCRGAVGALALLVGASTAAAQGAVEYYHLDALGSVRAVTNQAGTVIERHDYLAFGEECTTTPCSTAEPGTNSKKFTGKERDAETGLDYFGGRYLSSQRGRFTSPDPVNHPSRSPKTDGEFLSHPQNWNRYAYVLNMPLKRVDPDGLTDYLYVATNASSGKGVGLTAGHANLVRYNTDTNTTTTYGLWPDSHPSIQRSGLANGEGSDVRTNFPNDAPSAYPLKYGVELTSAQTAALDAVVGASTEWGYTYNCASWAGDTFANVTGVAMPSGDLLGLAESPRALGDAIKVRLRENRKGGIFPPGPDGAPGQAPVPGGSSSGNSAATEPRQP